MKKFRMSLYIAAGILLVTASALAAESASQQGTGRAVVTVMARNSGEEAAVQVPAQDLKVDVNGKQPTITKWVPLNGPQNSLEMVLLIDGSSRTNLGSQLGVLRHFVLGLPGDAKVAVAYMQNGSAVFAGPLSTDREKAASELRITGGFPGSSGSPYFCLSDLAKHWPSQDSQARREVLMVTDGVDYYNLRNDPEDLYVQTAISDSVRARLVVYSIYWRNVGLVDRTAYETNAGQSRLVEVTGATGGNSYYTGMGNPVSFAPYLNDLTRRLENQYELSFVSSLKGKPEIETLKLKIRIPGTIVDAPQQVFVAREGAAMD